MTKYAVVCFGSLTIIMLGLCLYSRYMNGAKSMRGEVKPTTADKFMNESGIAIYAEADLAARKFYAVKQSIGPESCGLFEQLVLYQSADT